MLHQYFFVYVFLDQSSCLSFFLEFECIAPVLTLAKTIASRLHHSDRSHQSIDVHGQHLDDGQHLAVGRVLAVIL